jgi:hypothetical protein
VEQTSILKRQAAKHLIADLHPRDFIPYNSHGPSKIKANFKRQTAPSISFLLMFTLVPLQLREHVEKLTEH